METVYSKNNYDLPTIKLELELAPLNQNHYTDINDADRDAFKGSALKETVGNTVVEKALGESVSDDKEVNGGLEENTNGKNTSRCFLCSGVTEIHYGDVCVPCHKTWHSQRLERFMTNKVGSCLVCINSVYSRIRPCKHDCTLVNAFVCSLCGSVFVDKSQLTKHMDNRYGKSTCRRCNTSFCYTSDKKSHKCIMRNHDSPTSSKDRNTCNLTSPLAINANVRKHRCTKCEKSFSRLDHLKQHMNIHENKRHYKCKHCKKSFNQSGNLKEHLKIHNNKRNYKCSYCKKSFNQSTGLKHHIRIHENKRNYKCTVCNRTFNNSSNLKQHFRIHENKQNYKCIKCEKSFNRPNCLKLHMMIHENKRNYKCTKCKASFNQPAYLKQHMLSHDNKRNYRCSRCNKLFSRSDHLKRHLMVHDNIKSHICTYCSKTFVVLGDLKGHLLIHENKRNYKCTHCQKSFNQSAGLRRHLMIHDYVY